MHPGDEVHRLFGPGGQRRPLGDFLEPGVMGLHGGTIGVPDVEPHPGVLGHHVGRFTAGLDHVMDSGGRLDMLPHHVDAVGHEFHRIERTPPVPRIERGVRGLAPELDGEVVVGLGAGVGNGVDRGGMPVERGVEVVEQTVACHVGLADQGFLGRGAVQPNGALDALRFHGPLERNGRADGTGAEQVMAAALARKDPVVTEQPFRGDRVADPGQRVVLGEDPDDRAARAELRHEGGRHPGAVPLEREAFLLEQVGQVGGGSSLQHRDLGVVPQRLGHRPDLAGQGIDVGDGGLPSPGRRLGRQRGGESGQQQHPTEALQGSDGVAPALRGHSDLQSGVVNARVKSS